MGTQVSSLAARWAGIMADEDAFNARRWEPGEDSDAFCAGFVDAIDLRITELVEAPIGSLSDAEVKLQILEREFSIGPGASLDGEKLCAQLKAWLGCGSECAQTDRRDVK